MGQSWKALKRNFTSAKSYLMNKKFIKWKKEKSKNMKTWRPQNKWCNLIFKIVSSSKRESREAKIWEQVELLKLNCETLTIHLIGGGVRMGVIKLSSTCGPET